MVGSHRHRVVLDVATRPGLSGHPVIDANTTLIAAASDLAVALARVEWACLDVSDQPTICPACIGVREHFDRCPLDAALTKAGVTPELRARIRKGGA